MSERAVPFHCPYCGDEDLRPSEGEGTSRGEGAAWECRSCSRAFRLKFLGLLAPGATGSAPAASDGGSS
ncbi:hypothetical protein [Streptomyces sp. GS7]|uniref:hypothetical protein n=1 Tax=Streptomyces sp. GS7 TaxID=2692234 RepID=UPI001317D115|nr:hypothetical protein [Streptomyces sp. GS7]QHC24863.1 hypothetical protein GR130_29320 [Streptomyces sp. GS7]